MPYRKLVTKTLQRYWRLTRSLHLDVAAIVRDGDGNVLLVRDGHDGAPWQLPGGPVLAGLTAEASVRHALGRTVPHAAEIELSLVDIFALEAEPIEGHIALYEGHARALPTGRRAAAELLFAPADRLPQPMAQRTRAILAARSTTGAAQQS